jgi:hypothetical protein
MSTRSAITSKKTVSTRLVRLAAATALGVAAFTTAAPAMAIEPPEPPGGSAEHTQPFTGAADDNAAGAQAGSVDLSSAGLGALAGIALGGAGLWISLGVQRRRDRSTSHA